ncbi:toll-like receptor 8 [Caerostris extrusa]|uniref:Toll-like receptor 8 n=1 Tax=Caerostris extrusa TaxID=172846 RepID=A0AAV4PXY0_CAEEX|nr:toll-like receptor 8 [Caerostris extrusa]
MLKIFCSCIYLTCILAINIRELVAQNFTTEDYRSKELEGCRLENNSEIVGLVAFCTQYQSIKRLIYFQGLSLDFSYISYCIPKVLDVAKIVYCTLGPLLVFGTVLVLVWYRFKWDIKYFLFLARSRTRTFKEQVICDRYAFDAFISYCDKDLPWVRNHLLPAIENDEDRISCCIPDRNFIAGNCALNTTASYFTEQNNCFSCEQ